MASPYLPSEQAVVQSAPEILGIERQRKLANLLTSQAFQQPQGQMISGHYVAPSWTQQLAPLANALAGEAVSGRADKQQQELALALRGKKAEENAAISEAIAQKDWNKASALISGSETGAGKEYLPLIAPHLIPEIRKPQVVSPGASLVDENGKVIYQAPFRPLAGAGGAGGDMGAAGEGHFKKNGDWITPDGRTSISKQDVSKDRAIIQTAQFLRSGLDKIKEEDIKKSDTVLGDVSQNNPNKSFWAKKAGFEDAVSAQTKINSSSVMQLLNNLPPGPASDKDILMAKSTFPGYGSERALKEWISNTKTLLDDKVAIVNSKYGSENWYGASGTTNKSKPKTSYSATNLPPGVSKELWNVMTDEEKAAFQ